MTNLATTDDLFFGKTGLDRDRVTEIAAEALSGVDDGELFLEYCQSESISFDDGRFQLGAAVFRQETENLIDFDFAIGGYLNIAEVETTGLELSGALMLSDALSLSLDYAYIDAEDGDGNALPRLPEHSGDLTLSYASTGPFSGAVLLRYNGSETNTDTTTLDSWLRVDVTGRYALSERVEVYGRIENLFDEDYQQILGYGTPGLSGSLGIRLRY